MYLCLYCYVWNNHMLQRLGNLLVMQVCIHVLNKYLSRRAGTLLFSSLVKSGNIVTRLSGKGNWFEAHTFCEIQSVNIIKQWKIWEP